MYGDFGALQVFRKKLSSEIETILNNRIVRNTNVLHVEEIENQ